MNIPKILQELDRLYAEGSRYEIEVFLTSQRQRAMMEGDWSARIMLQNEMIGLYRTLGHFEEGIDILEDTLRLFENHGLNGTIPYAGTMLNGASLYRAAGQPEEALELFLIVREIYERELAPDDYRLSGFYNNMALLYLDLQNLEASKDYLEKALGIVEKLPESSIEQATSHTTLANLTSQMGDMTDAMKHLDAAERLFASVSYKDPHYASYLASLAQIQVLNGEDESAVISYQRALEEIEKYYGKNRSYEITKKNLETVLARLDSVSV